MAVERVEATGAGKCTQQARAGYLSANELDKPGLDGAKPEYSD